MSEFAPPLDPYKALGLDKNATSAAIKTAYRKAALRCHPDKTQDKALIDQFHSIQQAYDLLGDEDKRKHFDNTLKLAELKRELHRERPAYTSRDSNRSGPRSNPYDPRNTHNTTTGYTSNGPSRFEERKPKDTPPPSASYGRGPRREDYFDRPATDNVTSRKAEATDPAPRKAAPQSAPKSSSKAESVRSSKLKSDRADTKKQRDRDVQRERGRKYSFTPADESDSSEGDAPRSAGRRPAAPSKTQPPPARDSRRTTRETRRGSDDDSYDDETYRRYKEKENFIRGYTARTAARDPPRRAASPPPSSFRQPPPEPKDVRRSSTGSQRPSLSRRGSSSSSKPVPKESRTASSSRRTSRDYFDSDQPRRGVTGLFESYSAPLDTMKQMMKDATRGRSDDSFDRYNEPRSGLLRADTIPARRSMDREYEKPRSGSGPVYMDSAPDVRPARPERSESDRTLPRTSARRTTDAAPKQSSNLRAHAETHNDSGYSTSNSPNETVPPQFPEPSSKQYLYGASNAQPDAYPSASVREPAFDRYAPRREDSRYASASDRERDAPRTTAPPLSRSARTVDPAAVRTRPSLSRSNSTQGSSRPHPGLSRGQTMPSSTSHARESPIFNTGVFPTGKDGNGRIFGDRVLSPEPMSPGAADVPSRSFERMPRYDEAPRRAYSERDRPDASRGVLLGGVPYANVNYGKTFSPDDVAYTPGLSRRPSNARAPPSAATYATNTHQPRRASSSAGNSSRGFFSRTPSRREVDAY